MAETTKACVACAESINSDARLCKHCKTMQDDTRFIKQSDKNSSSVATFEEGRCPWCEGEMLAGIMKCPNCGKFDYSRNESSPGLRRPDRDVFRDRNSTTGTSVGTPGIAIAAIICAFFVPILGLILGYSARNEIRASHGTKNGEGLATAAIVIGWIEVIALLVWSIGWSVALNTVSNS